MIANNLEKKINLNSQHRRDEGDAETSSFQQQITQTTMNQLDNTVTYYYNVICWGKLLEQFLWWQKTKMVSQFHGAQSAKYTRDSLKFI